ncbi:hypothetical protein, partial [Sarcina sp. DSM 11001]|uniref:hypothetical protein n=1 Tax=Sarcina sp. DSM 11001 TaxID=1798184 RepID=UPI001A9A4F38
MKWERGRHVMAILLSLVLVLCSTGLTAFAEEIPAANAGQAEEVFSDDGQQDTSSEVTDEEALSEDDPLTNGSEDQDTWDGPAVSFEQSEAVDGVVVTVTADPGVFDADASLSIIKTDSEDFRQASEAELAIEASDTLLIRHAIYSFSGAVMNGGARAELAYLDLSALQQQYPEGEISVAVLRYKDAEQQLQDRAETLSSEYDIYGDTVSFSMPAPGLFDAVTMIRLPESEELPADQEIEEAGSEGITEEAAQTAAEDVSEQEAEVVEAAQTAAEDVSGQEETDAETFETAAEAAAGQEETTEGSRVQEPSEESTGDAPAEEGSDETDSPVEIQPVLVTFISDPETAVVAVYPAATEEVPDPEAIPAQDDGSFLLLPGEYTYNAEAEGYVSAEDVSFTVADTALTLSV